MNIYSLLQIGDYHLNHCEDYLFNSKIGNNKLLCAVMDGCSMGHDSYFVATLTGKILRKIVKELEYEAFYAGDVPIQETESCLKNILRKLFLELRHSQNQLMLESKELLCTLSILLMDIQTGQGLVYVIGDGWVSIDGTHTEFDQNNKPDYLGYHLHEDFDSWYARQKQVIKFNNVQDISIATDGIDTFTPVKKVPTTDSIHPIDFLLVDRTHQEHENMLSSKLKNLEFEYGLKPTDDLAILRIIR